MLDEELKALPGGRILAIDYGRKRMGLAVSDPSQTLASTLCTLYRRGEAVPFDEILRAVAEQLAVALVVGNPIHMDGHEGDRSAEVDAFVRQLKEQVSQPIFLWDERWTTRRAHASLHERGQKPSKSRDQVDQIAAAFLLQSFLDRLRHLRRSS